MSFRYSLRYHPPMPTAEIALGAPEADFTLGPLPAILDTGGDITLIPREYLIQLDGTECAQLVKHATGWAERDSAHAALRSHSWACPKLTLAANLISPQVRPSRLLPVLAASL
jgi:hypothetical protein